MTEDKTPSTETPIPEAPRSSERKLGREVHIFAADRVEPPPSNSRMVAMLAAGCTVLGVLVGFSLGMVAGSHSTDIDVHCPAATATAATPALANQALQTSQRRPGFLGVRFVTHVPQDGDTIGAGAFVTDVFQKSVASQNDLREGDVIVSVDGTPIRTAKSLVRAIWSHEVGEHVTISYWRDGLKSKVVALGPTPRWAQRKTALP